MSCQAASTSKVGESKPSSLCRPTFRPRTPTNCSRDRQRVAVPVAAARARKSRPFGPRRTSGVVGFLPAPDRETVAASGRELACLSHSHGQSLYSAWTGAPSALPLVAKSGAETYPTSASASSAS